MNPAPNAISPIPGRTSVFIPWAGTDAIPSPAVEGWFLLTGLLGPLLPGKGTGLLLGIVGTLLCLLSILLYVLRKRLPPLQGSGPKRYWLNLHILLGTLGPLLLIGHAHSQLLGIKGLVNLALWATVISGFLARFLATRCAVARTRRLRLLEELNARYDWNHTAALFFLSRAQRQRLQQILQEDPLDQPPQVEQMVRYFFRDLQILWVLKRATQKGYPLPDKRRCKHSPAQFSGELDSPGHFRAPPEAFSKHLILQRNLLLLNIYETSAPFWTAVHTGLSIGFLLFLNLHIAVVLLFAPQFH